MVRQEGGYRMGYNQIRRRANATEIKTGRFQWGYVSVILF